MPEIHADKFCSNGNLLGSVCEYSCKVGFTLEGQLDVSVCIETTNGARWSNPTPICRPGKQLSWKLFMFETFETLETFHS